MTHPDIGTTPRVTVVIPVFNQGRFLPESVDSVLDQTWRDFELIVVDDGSTDDTPQILAEYGNSIRALRKPNGGLASALNMGVRNARGEWIAWLSADDAWERDKLAQQLDAIRSVPTTTLAYTDYVETDEAGRAVREVSRPAPKTRFMRLARLLLSNYINGSTVLIRKDVLETEGMFDELNQFSQDFDLWFRIAKKYDIMHIPRTLVRYRVHPGQSSVDVSAVQRSHDEAAARRIRELNPGEGALCMAVYLIALAGRVFFQVKKRSGARGAPLFRILENNFRFLTLILIPARDLVFSDSASMA